MSIDVARLPLVSRQEVAGHTGRADLWVIVDDLVLNVSAFDYHPGGMAPFLTQPGGDVTQRFYEINHSDEAKEALKGLAVARLKPPTRSSGWTSALVLLGSVGVLAWSLRRK